jgi:two-component system, cell cycle sensor histidine kinase and response regulator CckA
MHEQTKMGIEAAEWNCDAVRATLGGTETILYVEDEAFVRNVTSEILRSVGYMVLTCENAADALAVYNECHGEVDLLLTDVILPGETGRTLAYKLRLQNPAISVLLVTGYAEQMKVLEIELEKYLAKPFSSDVLVRKIRETLDQRQPWVGEQALLRQVAGRA